MGLEGKFKNSASLIIKRTLMIISGVGWFQNNKQKSLLPDTVQNNKHKREERENKSLLSAFNWKKKKKSSTLRYKKLGDASTWRYKHMTVNEFLWISHPAG